LKEGNGRAPEFKEEAIIRLSMRAVKDKAGKDAAVGESSEEVETSIFVGQKDTAPAVELAVKSMREGERALVRGDPRFAYPEGREPLIPPNSFTEFTVELIKIRCKAWHARPRSSNKNNCRLRVTKLICYA
jgi:FKBP-type peptidyl-prolyl cis-trans isomerase 2